MKKEKDINPFSPWTKMDYIKAVGFFWSAPFFLVYAWVLHFKQQWEDLWREGVRLPDGRWMNHYSSVHDELTIDGVTTNAKGETWKY